jgi:hypothetical protein
MDVAALGERDRRIHGVFTGAAPMAHDGGISWRDIGSLGKGNPH